MRRVNEKNRDDSDSLTTNNEIFNILAVMGLYVTVGPSGGVCGGGRLLGAC